MAQRQFRSDDTATWNHKFGYATDGTFSSSTQTWNPTRGSCSGAASQADLTITQDVGTFANNELVVIHQARGTGEGQWELNRISSGGGTTTLTMDQNLINTYTDSGDSQAQVVKIYEYDTFTLDSAHTVTLPAWDGNDGGLMAIAVTGTCDIQGTILGNAKGFLGGVNTNRRGGYSGEGSGGSSSQNNSLSTDGPANGNGGGGGASYVGTPSYWGGAGGGGGGNGAAGTDGTPRAGTDGEGKGGTEQGSASLTNMVFGGGGGSGGGDDNTDSVGKGGAGGKGGGILLIMAKNLTISGTISLDGENGYTNEWTSTTSNFSATGGGGAGGSCLLKAQTAALGTTKIGLTAGTGGVKSGSSGGGSGGNGAVGRVHLDYLVSYTGTTTPTIDVSQDLSLRTSASTAVII